jgi:hypothetical protein
MKTSVALPSTAMKRDSERNFDSENVWKPVGIFKQLLQVKIANNTYKLLQVKYYKYYKKIQVKNYNYYR